MPSKLIFPVRGASNASSFIEQPGDTAPFEALRNVRPYSSAKDRPRGGQRPSIVKSLEFDFDGEFQAMEVVSRASFVTGYQESNCTAVGGVTRLAGALQGQVWWLKPNLSMYHDIYDSGGTGTENAACVAVSKTQPRMCYGLTYHSAPNTTGHVAAYNTTDKEFQWEAIIAEAGVNRFVNTVEFGREYVFVTTNTQVQVYDAMTGGLIGLRELGIAGDNLASEVVCARAWINPETNIEYLFVAFNGIDTASVLPNTGETITGGDQASMFRSGVAKFVVSGSNDLTPGELSMVQYGTALDPSDPWWEYAHKTFRVSENTIGRPHGCWVNDLAVASDGSVFVARTNQGWGPNPAYLVNGSQAPYVTVFKIDPDGVMAWERDTDSIKSAGYSTGNNDIPTGPTDDPSILAVAVDGDDNVYAAGRRNAAGATDGANVFYLDGAGGGEFWRQNLSGTIRQSAAFVDPTDNNCWFAGDRNSDWTGASSTMAHLWKTNQFGGAVLRHFDLNEANKSATGVCVDSQTGREGRIHFVTDYIS